MPDWKSHFFRQAPLPTQTGDRPLRTAPVGKIANMKAVLITRFKSVAEDGGVMAFCLAANRQGGTGRQ